MPTLRSVIEQAAIWLRGPGPAGLARSFDAWAMPAGLTWLIVVMIQAYRRQRHHFDGWFGWADQGRYLASARGWASLNLDPAVHHYPAGYSLMAAPFVPIMPAQPFAVPDMICLGAALWIFARIARRLVPPTPGWRSASVFAFCLATTATPTLRSIWAVPWNTTGSAPWHLGALLATLWLIERPAAWRAAAAGLSLGFLLGIRPTDALVLAPCCGITAAWAVRRQSSSALLRLAGAGVAGVLVGVLPAVLAHLAVHGFAPGAYFAKSAQIGFEWRLIPLHWVLLVLDPRPFLAGDPGMAEAMPWIAPGFAGLLLLTWRGGQAAAWRLVASAVLVHWLLYLSYRDLHTYALWHFFGVHYFKWTFPFLTLAGMRLGALLAMPGRRAAAGLALVASGLLLIWQPFAVAGAHVTVGAGETGRSRSLAVSLSPWNDAVYLPLSGGWWQILAGQAVMSTVGAAPGVVLSNTRDFKLMPTLGGAMLQPLRMLPQGPYVFEPAAGTALRAGADIVPITISLQPGLPCGILPQRAGCRPFQSMP